MKQIPLFLILIALSGCKVGPNYHPPVTPMPEEFTENLEDQTFSIADEDLFQWWAIFNDPFLNDLLEDTLWGNFDYRIALEQIVQARAQYWIQFTQILPELEFDFQASRFRTSQSFATATPAVAAAAPAAAATTTKPAAVPTTAATISPIRNFFQTGFDAIWEIDLFGKLRRSADAAYDTWEATAEEAQAIKIVALSEVADTYATICAFQTKVGIASQIVDLDRELLELSESRFEAGLTNEQEVQGAIAALETDSANLFSLQAALKVNIYSLATLLGREPESLIGEFQENRPIPYAAERVPAGLPSDLLRRRPDIRSAERNLAAATEQIGVAVADLFPQLSLTGSSSSFAANPLQGANIGFSSDTASKLFDSASRIWGIGGLVTFPVFDFGKRLSAVDVQISLEKQAYLAYQKTVIAALQEVEQALTSYFSDEKRVQDLSKEALAYQRILNLVADEFEAGLADFSQVIQAKEAWLASINILTDSQQALTTDLIAVYKAMGGDW
ncbi:MAG: efflux transporter outer membrane subunit [Chlamydiales bacterium]